MVVCRLLYVCTECIVAKRCVLEQKLAYSIGLCIVLRSRQDSIGYMGDGFYRSKDPTNSI